MNRVLVSFILLEGWKCRPLGQNDIIPDNFILSKGKLVLKRVDVIAIKQNIRKCWSISWACFEDLSRGLYRRFFEMEEIYHNFRTE